jgi:hypothetical protein
MGSIQRYIRERKSRQLFDQALDYKSQGKFAEAAKVHMLRAELVLNDNELIYSSNCQDAFEMWMKAGEVDKALEQARNALKGYTFSDWLKGENRYIDDLVKMVGELYRADHYDEADAFLKEINAYLRSIGEDRSRWHCGAKHTNFRRNVRTAAVRSHIAEIRMKRRVLSVKPWSPPSVDLRQPKLR